jgi:peptidyl-prolyl cis-trans isomerase SurA
MRRSLYPGLLVLLFAGAGAASGQEAAAPQFIDRIVAIVGNSPILASQVEEQLLMAQSQGAKMPDDSAGRTAMRRQILDNIVDEELLVQQASRDTSIRLTEQEIQDQVEKTVQNVRKQFTTQIDFETQLRAAGFASEEEWRRWLADNQRRTIQQQRLIEGLRVKGKLRAIPPTEAQMREFWNEQSGAQRPKHPPIITFKQIVIAAQPDSAEAVRTRALAESLVVVLRHGGNFAEIAKAYSADSASRSQGGELGWFRRGVMVKNFEDVAFHLKPGQISDVVPTPFGYHVIQVERIEPAEIQARHILIQPRISAARQEIARRLADSVWKAVAAGASFDVLAHRYSDPEEPISREAVPVADLPPDYRKALAKDTVPALVAPFEIDSATARPKFVIVEIDKWEPEGELTFEDVKDRLRSQVGQQLAVKQYISTLRRSTYVAILP